MPQFTDEKRRRIRNALLDRGYERFAASGLSGTTIGDLTDDVGIADGTFYSFFDSKEDLLAAVLRRESKRVYGDLREALAANDDDPATAIRRFLEVACDALADDPLFSLSREERERLLTVLSEDDVEAVQSDKLSVLVPYLEDWQRRGLVVDGDPETIAVAILYVANLPHFRDEIDDDRYPLVRELLFDWVASGVTDV